MRAAETKERNTALGESKFYKIGDCGRGGKKKKEDGAELLTETRKRKNKKVESIIIFKKIKACHERVQNNSGCFLNID